MIVVSKLPNGMRLSDEVVLRPAMIGHEEYQKARAPGRERVAGYEVTRGVPRDVWSEWRGANAASPIIARKLVEGFEDDDEQAMNEFCWANNGVRGWQKMGAG